MPRPTDRHRTSGRRTDFAAGGTLTLLSIASQSLKIIIEPPGPGFSKSANFSDNGIVKHG
jgi:hypothetical protein